MTWQERRIVALLSTILAVLAVALIIVLSIRYRAARDAGDSSQQEGQLITAGAEGYTALSYYNGSATLSFSRDQEGAWVWADDPDFPLNDETISRILELLSQLKPQQTLTAEEGTSYGFDAPAATLTAQDAQGGTLCLVMGKTTTDGTSYYTRMNEDESTVYIFSGQLYEALQTPIYDMCALPQLPQLTQGDLVRVTIRGGVTDSAPAGTLCTLTPQQTQAGTRWTQNGADVTESDLIQALMEDLCALEVRRCVDYRPSDEAAELCGFAAPAAQVEVVYTTSGGGEQTLSFTVGSPLEDGSGRYVRLGEEAAIYAMDTACLDPLLPIAVQGLAALED